MRFFDYDNEVIVRAVCIVRVSNNVIIDASL